jgi:hypothetical protein
LRELVVETPPTLEYQTPEKITRTRWFAALVIRLIGITSTILGIVVGMTVVGLLLYDFHRGDGSLLDAIVALVWLLVTILCGFVYSVGGTIIQLPNRAWEVAIVRSAAFQFLFLIPLIVRQVFRGMDDPGNYNWLWGLCFFCLYALSSAIVFALACLVRRNN